MSETNDDPKGPVPHVVLFMNSRPHYYLKEKRDIFSYCVGSFLEITIALAQDRLDTGEFCCARWRNTENKRV